MMMRIRGNRADYPNDALMTKYVTYNRYTASDAFLIGPLRLMLTAR